MAYRACGVFVFLMVNCLPLCAAEDDKVDPWKVHCEQLHSENEDERSSGWYGIGWGVEYCPCYPGFKESLLTVLKDDSRRNEWERAYASLAICLKHDSQLNDDDVTFLLNQLPKSNFAARYGAIWCLGALTKYSEIVIRNLEPLLKDHSASNRVHTASSILRLDGKHELAMQTIFRELENDDPLVRHCAAFWLGRSGTKSEDAYNRLKSTMKDSDAAVRTMSACALWKLTKTIEDVLPVIVASLDDWPAPVVLGGPVYPSAGFQSHHLHSIACLGDMATASPKARDILRQLARGELTIRLDGQKREIRLGVLTAYAKSEYGVQNQFEASLAVAEHESDPLWELAARHIGFEKIDEMKRRVALWRRSCMHDCADQTSRTK